MQMNDGQAPYLVKQSQKFGFLDVNLMVEERSEDFKIRWNKQRPI